MAALSFVQVLQDPSVEVLVSDGRLIFPCLPTCILVPDIWADFRWSW